MDGILTALAVWLASHSAYPATEHPLPELVLLTPEGLTAEAYTDAPRMIPEGGVDDRINALYAIEDGANGVIYALAPQFVDGAEHFDDPADNPAFREIILHELVHHAQSMTGEYGRMQCRAQGERDAYLIGGRYLKSRHARDPLPNRNFWAHVYSRC
ncbi:hypothetical protein ACQ5SO_18175 [Rhodovulum sp. DZ06]|uniref:hypothetical protein n=1 Tax=Rhodovulum sp. DZ06 TaxID=3425126 RepID=UPI003D3265DE